MQSTIGSGVDHGVNCVPAGFGDQFFNGEATPFNQAANCEPATTIVAREERSQQSFLGSDRFGQFLPKRCWINRATSISCFGQSAFHRVIDQPFLQGQTIDACHRANSAQHTTKRDGGKQPVDRPPQAASGVGSGLVPRRCCQPPGLQG